MAEKSIKDEAEPIAEEIMHNIAYYLRHNLSVWPKEADIKDMKRIVKSIIVQHLMREAQSPK